MPEGLETVVGEKGVSLSGGQKQRLSLARAFLRNSEVLLLDDALSAVDAKTEQAIITNLKTMKQAPTSIIVTHRLSAITEADQIIVLEDGRITTWYPSGVDRNARLVPRAVLSSTVKGGRYECSQRLNVCSRI